MLKVNEVRFRVVGDGYEEMPDDFKPEKGTVKGAIATCLVCGSTVDANTTRRLFQEEKAGEWMVAVVLHHPKMKGKFYRVANGKDMEVFRQAEKELRKKIEELRGKWGIEPIPDELLPPRGTLGFRIQPYGMNTWGDLFNSRQKLALITFVDKVREAYRRMVEEGHDEEYAKAVVTYLGLNLNRLTSYCSSLGYWHVTGEKMSPAMQRQAIAMVFDYSESNPFAESFSWATNLDWILRVIEHCTQS